MAKVKRPLKAKKQTKVIEKIYDGVGPYYNFVFGKLLFQNGREVAINLLELKPKQKVLEVGVGTGLALPAYPRNVKVTGVDISASMLKEAEGIIAEHDLKNVTVKQMDATKLEFPDASFDSVLGNLFISATSFPRESLLEMRRVCKPGGVIVLMNHFRSEHRLLGRLEDAFNPIAQRIGFKSNLEMGPLLESVGLVPREIHKVNIFNMWTAVSMRNE